MWCLFAWCLLVWCLFAWCPFAWCLVAWCLFSWCLFDDAPFHIYDPSTTIFSLSALTCCMSDGNTRLVCWYVHLPFVEWNLVLFALNIRLVVVNMELAVNHVVTCWLTFYLLFSPLFKQPLKLSFHLHICLNVDHHINVQFVIFSSFCVCGLLDYVFIFTASQAEGSSTSSVSPDGMSTSLSHICI